MEEDPGSTIKGRKAQVHTSQVIDSLGKITHVFSDKTGTLTQNVMESQIRSLDVCNKFTLHFYTLLTVSYSFLIFFVC